jgi:tetratricopeptide (TPR) repeat protein
MLLRDTLLGIGLLATHAVVVTSLPASALSDQRKDILRWIHWQITEDLEDYRAERRPKALAGCVNWERSSPTMIDVRHLFSYYSAEASDVPVFVVELRRSAVTACKKRRKKSKSNCKCVEIDTNGKSVLKVPNFFIEKLQAADVLATEGKRLQIRQKMREGLAAYERSQYDRAIRGYTEAIRLDPDYAAAFKDRGNAYRRKHEYDRAIQDYDEAIRLKPDYALAFNNRGLAYYYKHEYDWAIRDYTEAIRLKPDYAAAFKNRGNAYSKKGEYDRANQDYKEARRLAQGLQQHEPRLHLEGLVWPRR